MKSAQGSRFAILTDTTLCTGCEECVKACKKNNDLGKDRPRRWNRTIDDLSATRFTTILRKDDGVSVRRQCRHCQSPACVSACIVGALQKSDEGPVIYDDGKCIGCRYCMLACPYGIPRFEWSEATPYIRKCDFCYDEIMAGEIAAPACVGACPEMATIFGTRDEMLQEAKQRIAAAPGKYWQDRVYGETEVGGTSVLYLSDRDLGFLAWKTELGDQPLPELTAGALATVPPTIVGVGGAMAAVWWIIGRRMAMQAEHEVPEGPVEDSGDEGAPSASQESETQQ